MEYSLRSIFWTSKALHGFACALSLGLATGAQALPDWAATPYEYVVLDQDIRATLTDFGRNLGLAVSLSDAVKGHVRGRVEAQTAGDFLDRISEANGLNWYFDGSILHVSAASEFATRIVATEGADGAAVLPELQRLGLADDRFGIRQSGHMISVSGPPAYVETVRGFIAGMRPATVAAQGDDPRVRVFRGRVGNEETPIPQP